MFVTESIKQSTLFSAQICSADKIKLISAQHNYSTQEPNIGVALVRTGMVTLRLLRSGLPVKIITLEVPTSRVKQNISVNANLV